MGIDRELIGKSYRSGEVWGWEKGRGKGCESVRRGKKRVMVEVVLVVRGSDGKLIRKSYRSGGG